MTRTPQIDLREDYQVNHAINGNLDFWQRGTNFTSLANGDYTADRVAYYKSGSMVHDVSQSSDTPNSSSTYSLQLDCTTSSASLAASDFTSLKHIVEGYSLQLLAGKTITFSFWVYASKTGTYCVSFRNTGNTRSYVTEYQVNAANTWEKKVITITHDETGTWNYTNGVGLDISWTIAAGTDYQTTADSWQSGNYLATSNQVNACDSTSNVFRVAQFQLVEGAEELPFRRAGKDITEEEAKCQRYTYFIAMREIGYAAAFDNRLNYILPTTMRVNPTVSATFNVTNNTSNAQVNANIDYMTFQFGNTYGGSSQTDGFFDFAADILIDAELTN